MRIIKLLPLLIILVSCKTPAPPLISFYIGDGVTQHFLSPTEWTSRNSTAKLDITYRTLSADMPAIINISFYGNKIMPGNVRSVSLHGQGEECLLEYDFTILTNPGKYELRIAFTADREDLIDLFETEPITLRAEVDGVVYVYNPEKNFYELKNKLMRDISNY